MSLPWLDGLYSFSMGGKVVMLVDIQGESGQGSVPGKDEDEQEKAQMKIKVKSGIFSNPDKRGLDATGKENYDVEIYYVHHDLSTHGVLSEDKKKITMMDGNILELMDEEAKKNMKVEQDPAENPPNNYSPKAMGKILWISGMSGMGKTTTAKLLQKKEGFVNYEGDCFIYGLNPYVGAAPEGSSFFGTRNLSGISQKRKDVCKASIEKGYTEIFKGNSVDPKIWEDLYDLICEDILKGRAKIGGDWVVGQAVYTKAAREYIGKKLGADLTMVVLESGEENLQLDRLATRVLSLGAEDASQEAREAAEKQVAKSVGGIEPVEVGEQNTFAIKVTKTMTPDDVAKIALTHMG